MQPHPQLKWRRLWKLCFQFSCCSFTTSNPLPWGAPMNKEFNLFNHLLLFSSQRQMKMLSYDREWRSARKGLVPLDFKRFKCSYYLLWECDWKQDFRRMLLCLRIIAGYITPFVRIRREANWMQFILSHQKSQVGRWHLIEAKMNSSRREKTCQKVSSEIGQFAFHGAPDRYRVATRFLGKKVGLKMFRWTLKKLF